MRQISLLVPAISALLLLSCVTEQAADQMGPSSDALRAEAAGLREMIVEYQLARYAEAEFKEADDAYKRGIAVSGDSAAPGALEAAVEGFQTVYEAGFRELLVRKRNAVERLIGRGIDARADILARERWADATESVTEADEAVDRGNYPTALVLYDEALADYGEAITAAGEAETRAEGR